MVITSGRAEEIGLACRTPEEGSGLESWAMLGEMLAQPEWMVTQGCSEMALGLLESTAYSLRHGLPSGRQGIVPLLGPLKSHRIGPDPPLSMLRSPEDDVSPAACLPGLLVTGTDYSQPLGEMTPICCTLRLSLVAQLTVTPTALPHSSGGCSGCRTKVI
ncbi:hypothetical protein GHT09_018830 [Marmota monax]|uniref:Uncharacterized protein n=1 Tax=Marmota monax TaxID=9995 RepID=A0A834UJL6_MARMO|nr:hypothetical protein GHT09_018830 [Marmota monax]